MLILAFKYLKDWIDLTDFVSVMHTCMHVCTCVHAHAHTHAHVQSFEQKLGRNGYIFIAKGSCRTKQERRKLGSGGEESKEEIMYFIVKRRNDI